MPVVMSLYFNMIECIFIIPPWIWAFGVSSHSQYSHELQKLKWCAWSKDHFSHWINKIIYEPCFHGRKKWCFVARRPLDLDVQPMFCWFSSINEHENMNDQWMLVLYPASVVISSVITLCFIWELIKPIK